MVLTAPGMFQSDFRGLISALVLVSEINNSWSFIYDLFTEKLCGSVHVVLISVLLFL